MLCEALSQTTLQFLSVTYCPSLTQKKQSVKWLLWITCVSYKQLYWVAWLLLGIKWMHGLESQKKQLSAIPIYYVQLHHSIGILLMSMLFVTGYTHDFIITLFSISTPVFSGRLITCSCPTHQQSPTHGQR